MLAVRAKLALDRADVDQERERRASDPEPLESVLEQRDAASGVRNAFMDFVNAWGATHGGLEAVSRIPASASNTGARAAKLLAIAFPDDEDPTSIERFLEAVAIPIDRYRSTRTTRDGELALPTEPIDPTEDPIDVTDPIEPVTPIAGPGTPAFDPSSPFTPEA